MGFLKRLLTVEVPGRESMIYNPHNAKPTSFEIKPSQHNQIFVDGKQFDGTMLDINKLEKFELIKCQLENMGDLKTVITFEIGYGKFKSASQLEL